jgi:hypothetical protein
MELARRHHQPTSIIPRTKLFHLEGCSEFKFLAIVNPLSETIQFVILCGESLHQDKKLSGNIIKEFQKLVKQFEDSPIPITLFVDLPVKVSRRQKHSSRLTLSSDTISTNTELIDKHKSWKLLSPTVFKQNQMTIKDIFTYYHHTIRGLKVIPINLGETIFRGLAVSTQESYQHRDFYAISKDGQRSCSGLPFIIHRPTNSPTGFKLRFLDNIKEFQIRLFRNHEYFKRNKRTYALHIEDSFKKLILEYYKSGSGPLIDQEKLKALEELDAYFERFVSNSRYDGGDRTSYLALIEEFSKLHSTTKEELLEIINRYYYETEIEAFSVITDMDLLIKFIKSIREGVDSDGIKMIFAKTSNLRFISHVLTNTKVGQTGVLFLYESDNPQTIKSLRQSEQDKISQLLLTRDIKSKQQFKHTRVDPLFITKDLTQTVFVSLSNFTAQIRLPPSGYKSSPELKPYTQTSVELETIIILSSILLLINIIVIFNNIIRGR